MIQVTCPTCARHLQVPENYAGQTGICTYCKSPFRVPIPQAAPAMPLASLARITVGLFNLTAFLISAATFLLVVTLIVLIGGCMLTWPKTEQGFKQRGYLKHANNHIRTIVFDPSKTPEQVRAYAERLHYTKGKMAAVYFYPQGTNPPADAVTFSGGVIEANEVIYDQHAPQWRYVFMRWFSGDTKFTDCALNPYDDLCKRD